MSLMYVVPSWDFRSFKENLKKFKNNLQLVPIVELSNIAVFNIELNRISIEQVSSQFSLDCIYEIDEFWVQVFSNGYSVALKDSSKFQKFARSLNQYAVEKSRGFLVEPGYEFIPNCSSLKVSVEGFDIDDYKRYL